MSKKNIVFVTGNKKKLDEVAQIFKAFYDGSVPFNFSSKKIDLIEIQGTQDEICRVKAQAAFEIIKGPCIVEDTSLCFRAMGGLPGPYVKWFLKENGPLGLYLMLKGFENKSATAVCTIGYVNEQGEVNIFTGEVNGHVVEPTTTETFGWDSCFQPDGYQMTFAHMSKEEKNRISHRTKAMLKLKEFLD